MYRIVSAVPRPDHTVAVQWSDGKTSVASFGRLLEIGGIYAPLRDRAFFTNELRIARNGRVLAWSEMLEFSADALRYEAFPADRERDLAGMVAAE